MFSSCPSGVPLGVWRRSIWFILLIVSSEVVHGVRAEFSYESITAVLARINISYIEPIHKKPRSISAEIGRFANGAIGPAGGVLVQAKPPANATSRVRYLQGCVPNWASPPEGGPWVALLIRGGCSDAEKVKLAMTQNASAVLLFGSDPETSFQEPKFKGNAVVIYLLRNKGEQFSKLLNNGTKVYVSITRGQEVKYKITSFNRTSVLFVSVSFIVLMVVSLAWLIFYYIQRFRYINAKDRLARHLSNAAKKALAKIPVKNMKAGDKEIEETESCAVCIEPYQAGDTIRSLPCKHEFHKGCVDPWLLEHRTCPMCKMDILKFYGYTPSGSDGNGTQNNSLDEASVLESGTSHGNRDLSPSDRNNGSHEPLQVSVISHSEVIPGGGESLERASSNPVSDSPISIPLCQPTLSFGTTTAAIRSILSVRPQVAPVGFCSGSLPAVHQRNGAFPLKPEGSRSFKNTGGGTRSSSGNQSNNSNGNAESSNNDSSNLPSATSAKEAIPTVTLPVLPSAPPAENAILTVTLPVLPSAPLAEKMSLSESLLEGVSNGEPSTSQLICHEKENKNHADCDIECLVKEIIDLEQDEISSNKSDKASSKSSPHASATMQDVEVENTNIQPNHPASECIITPSSQAELPKVDCNPQTQIPLPLSGSASYNNPVTRSNRNLSSLTSSDNEESRRRDSVPASEERRPSSHLITITHS